MAKRAWRVFSVPCDETIRGSVELCKRRSRAKRLCCFCETWALSRAGAFIAQPRGDGNDDHQPAAKKNRPRRATAGGLNGSPYGAASNGAGSVTLDAEGQRHEIYPT